MHLITRFPTVKLHLAHPSAWMNHAATIGSSHGLHRRRYWPAGDSTRRWVRPGRRGSTPGTLVVEECPPPSTGVARGVGRFAGAH